ncbi:MAG: sensor histidine kinase [Bacteroidales bacterium]|jgi:signal transduction histidine kinase|nr:sensor histidine kinase [Bacteroidales bacterium]
MKNFGWFWTNTETDSLKATALSVVLAAMLLPHTALSRTDTITRPHRVDSLENALQQHPPTPELLHIYDALSNEYLDFDFAKSLEYARRGKAVAEQTGAWYEAARLSYALGHAYYYAGQYDSTLIYYDEALEIVNHHALEKARADEIEALIKSKTGVVYQIQGRLQEALQLYMAALSIAEQYQWLSIMENMYGNIGSVYITLHNYDYALEYYTKEKDICVAMNDSLMMSFALVGLSGIYNDRKEFDAALDAAQQAYRIVFGHPDASAEDKIFALQSLVEAYISFEKYDTALEYAQTALDIAEQWNSPIYIAWSLGYISRLQLELGHYKASEAAALRAMQTDSSDLFNNKEAHTYLAKAYIMMGEKIKANEYLNRLVKAADAYSNSNFQSQLSEMEVKYETAKKEMLIADMRERERRRMQFALAGGIILFLGLVTLFFAWMWAQQKRSKAELLVRQLEQEKQLVATQAVLDGETAERTRLARDLHDGLGGMLSAVKLNLDEMKRDAPPEQSVKEQFDTAITLLDESIREMRRVAHHLMPDSLSRYGLKTALTDFCRSIPVAVFSYYGDNKRLDSNLEVVIYRIIHEMVNNALKHAHASQIIVQIVHEHDRLSLTVEDNGRGFNPDAATEGMGIRNIRARVASFGGTIDLRTSEGNGTECNVEFEL